MDQLCDEIPEIILTKLKKGKKNNTLKYLFHKSSILAGINTFEDFLIKTKNEICSITKLSDKDVEQLTDIIHKRVLKKTFTKGIKNDNNQLELVNFCYF